MPANTVKVDRTSKWGNPYLPPNAVENFRLYAENVLTDHPEWLEPLRGKHLGCWCKPDSPCHADVLLELANK